MVKVLEYRDIAKNKYSITDEGVVTNLKTGKIVNYNDPKNNSGYCRITLRTKTKKSKKYQLHRLVLATFTYDCELEVNHKDGNKLNNSLINLEYVTSLENKHHAKLTGLYQSCDQRYNAAFTNEVVHSMCKLFESGKTPVKVMKKLGIPKTQAYLVAVDRISNKQTWRNISKYYSWDPNVTRYKKYTREHLESIAYLILFSDYTTKEICEMFSCYDQKKLRNVIGKMKAGKLYTKIMNEVKRSTTIKSELYDCNGFIILV